MSLDDFLTQVDDYTMKDTCQQCTGLREHISLMLEVMKAKESEINDLNT